MVVRNIDEAKNYKIKYRMNFEKWRKRMRLNNLPEIKWKCKKIYEIGDTGIEQITIDINGIYGEGSQEVSEKNEDFYEGNLSDTLCLEDSTKNEKRIVDGMLVDVLADLYYIKGLENYMSQPEEYGRTKYRRVLDKAFDAYYALLKLKQIYYEEVQESINKVNNSSNCECGFSEDIYPYRFGKNIINVLIQTEMFYQHLGTFFDDLHEMMGGPISARLHRKIICVVYDLYLYNCEHGSYKEDWSINRVRLWIKFFILFYLRTMSLAENWKSYG